MAPIALDPLLIPDQPRPAPVTPHVLHLGALTWPPNADGLAWFLREVWPAVRRDNPLATLDVVGRRPPRPVRSAAASAPGVQLAGHVDDLDATLRQAAVLVVPLRAGSGMRVKILTALAHGIPIVTTRLGCEGIAVADGEHLLIADDSHAFGAALNRLLKDPQLAARLTGNGRRLIEERYDARTALQPLHEVYEEIVGRRASGVGRW
jgi:glycosyltransferase involved in cell wall biosynthesis